MDTEVWQNTYMLCKCLTQMGWFISLYAKIRWFRKRLEGQKRHRNQSGNTIALLMIRLGSSCLKENNVDWVRGIWLGGEFYCCKNNQWSKTILQCFLHIFVGFCFWFLLIHYFHGLQDLIMELQNYITVTHLLALVRHPKYPNNDCVFKDVSAENC